MEAFADMDELLDKLEETSLNTSHTLKEMNGTLKKSMLKSKKNDIPTKKLLFSGGLLQVFFKAFINF